MPRLYHFKYRAVKAIYTKTTIGIVKSSWKLETSQPTKNVLVRKKKVYITTKRNVIKSEIEYSYVCQLQKTEDGRLNVDVFYGHKNACYSKIFAIFWTHV